MYSLKTSNACYCNLCLRYVDSLISLEHHFEIFIIILTSSNCSRVGLKWLNFSSVLWKNSRKGQTIWLAIKKKEKKKGIRVHIFTPLLPNHDNFWSPLWVMLFHNSIQGCVLCNLTSYMSFITMSNVSQLVSNGLHHPHLFVESRTSTATMNDWFVLCFIYCLSFEKLFYISIWMVFYWCLFPLRMVMSLRTAFFHHLSPFLFKNVHILTST